MRRLVWSAGFVRAFRRAVRQQPGLHARAEHAIQRLCEDPFQPSLHAHKLKGDLSGVWACTVDYDNRILFEFVRDAQSGEEEIHLLTMGTHAEVY